MENPGKKIIGNKSLLAAGFFLVLPALLAIYAIFPRSPRTILPSKVCFSSYCFKVEIAQTPQDRERGLMFRQSMPQNQGMLFIFPGAGEYDFWMKNTLIPLDMIWIDADKNVVFIAQNVQPCKQDPCPIIVPGVQASYVLEINGGMAQRIGITVGEKTDF